MTIIQLTAENVKRLRAVSVKADGQSVVVVGGNNGQGKSSLLDSIAMALGGASRIPLEPVRRGAKNAKIVLETEELVVERRFTAAGGTSLEVRGKDGAKMPSPQAVLDKLCTSIAFDPLEFVRLGSSADGRRKQAAKLVELAGLNLAAFDHRKAQFLAQRTELKTKLDVLNSQGIEDQDIPARRDEAEVRSKIDRLRMQQLSANQWKTNYERMASASESAMAEIGRLQARIKELQTSLQNNNDQIEKLGPQPDDTAITNAVFAANTELSQVQQHNSKVDQLERNRAAMKKARETKETLETVETALLNLAKDRTEAIASAKFPVPGLGLSEDGMPTFNGIPLDQCSSAENIRIGIAMAIASSPGMPVMLIRDGSLLDYQTMNLIQEMADEAGAQVWIERVGAGSECSVIIEDGEVKDSPESPA